MSNGIRMQPCETGLTAAETVTKPSPVTGTDRGPGATRGEPAHAKRMRMHSEFIASSRIHKRVIG